MRGKYAGTIIYRNGKISKVDTKTSQTISAGVYPSWHPNGRYIAFSVNDIMQCFHSVTFKKVEVIDTLSDLILFDAETNMISTCPSISSKERYETFPTWSPDGHYLYYCSAKAYPGHKYNQIQYDLLRIAFNTDTRQFGAVDTVINASSMGYSISYPRISPDGKFVLYCKSEYGNFLTWHPDSDLYILNLETNEISKPDVNSNQSESFHSWSSTGRWIVFSSRRRDGFFVRPFIAYIDREGKGYKPFILPQKDPWFYKTLLECYNLPEFVTSRIELNPRIISKLNNLKAANATFEVSK
jgi:Tol biopolymer transport system component